jgi:hypothetical protein
MLSTWSTDDGALAFDGIAGARSAAQGRFELLVRVVAPVVRPIILLRLVLFDMNLLPVAVHPMLL